MLKWRKGLDNWFFRLIFASDELIKPKPKKHYYDYYGRHYFKLDLAIQYLDKLPPHCILQLLNEEDDVTTADIVLQTCLFGEVVFG